MKVILDQDGLIVVPSSDFEKQWLESTFNSNFAKTAFLKYGFTPKDLIGLKIKTDKE